MEIKSLDDVVNTSFVSDSYFLKSSYFFKEESLKIHHLIDEEYLTKDVRQATTLFVSHKWETKNHPDPRRCTFNKIRSLLVNSQYEFVWVDYCCIDQRRETDLEKKRFKEELKKIDKIMIGSNMAVFWGPEAFNSGWCIFEITLHRDIFKEKAYRNTILTMLFLNILSLALYIITHHESDCKIRESNPFPKLLIPLILSYIISIRIIYIWWLSQNKGPSFYTHYYNENTKLEYENFNLRNVNFTNDEDRVIVLSKYKDHTSFVRFIARFTKFYVFYPIVLIHNLVTYLINIYRVCYNLNEFKLYPERWTDYIQYQETGVWSNIYWSFRRNRIRCSKCFKSLDIASSSVKLTPMTRTVEFPMIDRLMDHDHKLCAFCSPVNYFRLTNCPHCSGVLMNRPEIFSCEYCGMYGHDGLMCASCGCNFHEVELTTREREIHQRFVLDAYTY